MQFLSGGIHVLLWCWNWMESKLSFESDSSIITIQVENKLRELNFWRHDRRRWMKKRLS